jgi:hypothetical protein
MKVREMNPRGNLCSKDLFSTEDQNSGNIQDDFKVSLAKFIKILLCFPMVIKFYWCSANASEISRYYAIVNYNFAQFCNISFFYLFTVQFFGNISDSQISEIPDS